MLLQVPHECLELASCQFLSLCMASWKHTSLLNLRCTQLRRPCLKRKCSLKVFLTAGKLIWKHVWSRYRMVTRPHNLLFWHMCFACFFIPQLCWQTHVYMLPRMLPFSLCPRSFSWQNLVHSDPIYTKHVWTAPCTQESTSQGIPIYKYTDVAARLYGLHLKGSAYKSSQVFQKTSKENTQHSQQKTTNALNVFQFWPTQNWQTRLVASDIS